MKRCAFLTHEALPDGTADDRLTFAVLLSLGWTVDALPWSSTGVAWDTYDAVVVRSTWDYHRRATEFLGRLAEIERAGARLFNSLEMIAWNASKTYLRDLAARAVPTVPTIWRDRLGEDDLASVFDELGVDEIIVKPVVGASAEGIERLDRRASAGHRQELASRFADRPLLAQPVVRAIFDEGEYSLIYLDGAFSHAVCKAPRAGDFRVQEEHGGMSRDAVPEPSLCAAADASLAVLDERPLYARVDVVRANDDASWWLMELELIEPALYLGRHEAAPERLARALDRRVRADSMARVGRRGSRTE
jgi:glutathione synthase/RimK-type ligase-like ATP-grasp enzyme